MEKKKILLLLGHPDKSGMCGAFADTYEAAARKAGHDITRLNVGDMEFSPDLKYGYRKRIDLEPDLVRFQELVKACDHFVVIHPIWWLGMPARLKGLFDRAWLPGSAFRYIRTKVGTRTIFWDRLLKGKTARIIVTSGMNRFIINLIYLPGNVNSQLRWGILWFAGFSVRTSWFGPAEDTPEDLKQRWIEKVRKLGERGI
ncbi:MAG: NAD(P)H-dependent oxidoreductase [bacterium]|nr:NAD(P)H-dependent oxidoreductase [bacterium]